MKKLEELSDFELDQLIENRWASSETVWTVVKRQYEQNLRIYQNNPSWLEQLPVKRARVRDNRIFPNVEGVINALISNPPKPNIIPTRDTPEAVELAMLQEKYFNKKYQDLNVKETLRKGLRNLYLGRLLVLKPFWDASINDFNVRAIDPRKIRVQKNSTKEEDSEFVIEEVTDNLESMIRRFPNAADKIKGQFGYSDETQILIHNPEVTYKEAWIRDYVVFKFNNIILDKVRNPYWDWDGLLVTPQEQEQLTGQEAVVGEERRGVLTSVRAQQEERAQTQQAPQEAAPDNSGGETMPLGEYQDTPQSLAAYFFNHFDQPRKPYIYATVFNNENTPIGQTDMIDQAAPLQQAIDRRKQDIDENASLVNGAIKVDSQVMSKADAQKLRYEARGVIWGKGVVQGVEREMGNPLPAFVYEDMVDSRGEIDNIMAASAAFRGEREGQETKAGRLALIEQSMMRLNELVQTVDYVNYELFNWFYQLAKVRYTEHHYAKEMGQDNALKIISLIQDDFQDGTEVKVIQGKTLPEDKQFKFEQAQKDMEGGFLSPVDYFTVAGYDNPQEKAKNAVAFRINPMLAVGMSAEEMQQLQPPPASEPPKLSLAYDQLPPDGQIQLAAKAGIQLDPNLLIAEKVAQRQDKAKEMEMKAKEPAKPAKDK